jgi:hypothetical protein
MERKLEEKDKDLEAQLRAQKDRLDKILEQRDMEHLLLQVIKIHTLIHPIASYGYKFKNMIHSL